MTKFMAIDTQAIDNGSFAAGIRRCLLGQQPLTALARDRRE